MKAIKTTLGQTGTGLYLIALIFGTLAGCGLIALLMCIVSLCILVTGKLPHDSLKWIMVAVCCFSSFISGYITSRLTKSNGLIFGAISGTIIFIIILIAGLICSDGIFSILTFIKLISIVLCGGLGGIKGVNKKDRIHIK